MHSRIRDVPIKGVSRSRKRGENRQIEQGGCGEDAGIDLRDKSRREFETANT